MVNGFSGNVAGETLQDLKENIFRHAREHIRGVAKNYADGRVENEPIQEEDGYQKFHGHVNCTEQEQPVLGHIHRDGGHQ